MQTKLEKTKEYPMTKFPSDVIQNVVDIFKKGLPYNCEPCSIKRYIKKKYESWNYDNDHDLFCDYASSDLERMEYGYNYCDNGSISVDFDQAKTLISVKLAKRNDIQAVFSIFEEAIQKYNIMKLSRPILFIGHGRKDLWRELKAHLEEQHGFKTEHYELDPKASLLVRDILEKMMIKSSIAIIVLTGEIEDIDGDIHARDNVIHELGLFQGKLGFDRVIILKEEGVSIFSNIQGINYIPFKDSIKETFGDLLANINRIVGPRIIVIGEAPSEYPTMATISEH